MSKLTATILGLAFLVSAPGIALADCSAHQATASLPATTVDASGTTTPTPPMTPIPTSPSGG